LLPELVWSQRLVSCFTSVMQDILKLEKQIEKTESALRLDLADLRKEQAVQRWMLTLVVGGIIALLGKAFLLNV